MRLVRAVLWVLLVSTIALTHGWVLDANGVTQNPFIGRRATLPIGSLTNVALDGTYTGTAPTGVQASWQGGSYGGLTSFTASGGVWSGTLASQARGDGTLNIRETNDNTVTATVQLTIGEVIVVWGDSRTVWQANGAVSTSTTPILSWYGPGPEWLNTRYINPTMYQWAYLAEQVRAATSGPVFVIHAGVSGTRLLSDWQPGGSNYVAMQAMVTASGIDKVTFTCGDLVVNDITVGTPTQAAVSAGYQAMATGMQADLPGAPITFSDIFSIRTWVGVWATSTDTDYIREVNLARAGQIDAAAAIPTVLYIAGNLTGQEYADHMHPTTDGAIKEWAARFWAGIGPVLYGQTNSARGPRFTWTINADRVTLRGTADQDLGNTLNANLVGFSIANSGSAVSITSCKKTATRTVTIVAASSLSGTPTVSFASGIDAVNATEASLNADIPYGPTIAMLDTGRTASVNLPAEPSINAAVTNAPTAGRFATVFAGVVR